MPQYEETHADGWCSVIGGQVYRGTCYPDMVGWHVYTDYAGNKLHKARLQATGDLEIVDMSATIPTGTASIHADARGELYLSNTSGWVYHLEVSP